MEETDKSFRVTATDKAKAIEYFDKVGRTYDTTVNKGFLSRFRNRERSAVLELADLTIPNGRMIDVGCGAGFYALKAKEKGLYVCAIDAAPSMVEQLKGKIDDARVIDLEAMPVNETFDRVVCAGLLDFVLDPKQSFSTLCRLVKPGGKLVILVPRRGPGGLFYRVEKWFFGIKINLFSLAWYRSESAQHGLTVKAWRFPLPTNMAVLFERSK